MMRKKAPRARTEVLVEDIWVLCPLRTWGSFWKKSSPQNYRFVWSVFLEVGMACACSMLHCLLLSFKPDLQMSKPEKLQAVNKMW